MVVANAVLVDYWEEKESIVICRWMDGWMDMMMEKVMLIAYCGRSRLGVVFI